MTSFSKRLSYLGLADIDYLSARILMLSGVPTTAFGKAAEAMEKILKLNLMLAIKIITGKELDEKALKKEFGHGIARVYNRLMQITNTPADNGFIEYFKILEESYKRRYPENWKSFSMEVDLEKFDKAYCEFRAVAALNFPAEEQERAGQFGTFLGDIYNPSLIRRVNNDGMLSPAEALRKNNNHIAKLGLNSNSKI